MAMICDKCGGVIKDISFGTENRCDCNNHIKIHNDIEVRNDYCKRCNKPLIVKTLDYCGCCLMFMKDENDASLGEPVA